MADELLPLPTWAITTMMTMMPTMVMSIIMVITMMTMVMLPTSECPRGD